MTVIWYVDDFKPLNNGNQNVLFVTSKQFIRVTLFKKRVVLSIGIYFFHSFILVDNVNMLLKPAAETALNPY